MYSSGGSADLRLYDVVLSPRGDALAIRAAVRVGDAIGDFRYDDWVYIVSFETTVYESKSILEARRLDIAHTNVQFDLRFTPAGDAVVVASINIDDPETNHTCFLYHAGVDTPSDFVQLTESCRPPMMVPGTAMARR